MAFDFGFKKILERINRGVSFHWHPLNSLKKLADRIPSFRQSFSEKLPRNFFSKASRLGKSATNITKRITRTLCFILSVGLFAAGAFVCALFYFVTADTAKDTLARFAHDSLNAELIVSGPIKLQRLPTLTVEFPQIQLKQLDTDSVLAEIDALRIDVSLWGLPLGAIRINHAQINGLRSSLPLNDFFGKEAFEKTFENLSFPANLRLREITVDNSTLQLSVNSQEKPNIFVLEDIHLSLENFSPETETALDASFRFKNADLSDSAAAFSGSVSLKTLADFSFFRRTLTFRDLNASGTLSNTTGDHILLATANRLRFKPDEATGVNAQLSVCAPDRTKGELTLSLASFLVNETRLSTPEIKLFYQKSEQDTRANLDVSVGIDMNREANQVQLPNISGTLNIKGLEGFPADFSSTLKGGASADINQKNLDIQLNGMLGQSTFTYNGNLGWQDSLQLAGSLRIASLELDTASIPSDLTWLHSFDFIGDLFIGKVRIGNLPFSQLHTKLSLTGGILRAEDALVNVADGRAENNLQISEDGQWVLESRFDSVAIEKLFETVQVSPLTGTANCLLKISGNGKDLASLSGQGKLRILRGEVRGINVATLKTSEQVADLEKQKTSFDELAGNFSLTDGTLSTNDLVLRNASNRMDASVQVDLRTENIIGRADILHLQGNSAAPTHVRAELSGNIANPIWKIQEKENAIEQPEKQQDEGLIKKLRLWKNLKNFFAF